MSFKIEIYYNGNKQKHKLYDGEKAYNRWWDKRKTEYEIFNNDWAKGNYGLVGQIDGKIDKTYGRVPNDLK